MNSKAALEEQFELCVKAFDLFASIYGAWAGNLEFKVLATGGIYIGGEIGRKIVKKLEDWSFSKAFKEKRRIDPLMTRMPVKVILNEKVALIGSAHYAHHCRFPKAI